MSAIVEKLVQRANILVFSTSWCPFCTRVKDLIRSKKLDFNEYIIDESTTEGAEVRAAIIQKYNHHTVPAVFIRGSFIGGYDDVKALSDSGKLQ